MSYPILIGVTAQNHARLSDMVEFTKRTERIANPHRIPDYARIRAALGKSDPEVHAQFQFIEEHNTGYDGNLVRLVCVIPDTDISFQVDVLPFLCRSEAPAIG